MTRRPPAVTGDVATDAQQFKALIENLREVTSILERDGAVRYVSPSVVGISGYTADELAGSADWQLVHPEDVAAAQVAFQSALDAPDTAVTQTFRCRHRDGSWRDIEQTIVNRLDDPAVHGLVAVAHDVTDRAAADRRLRSLTRMHAVRADIGVALARGRDSVELLAAVCAVLVETGDFAAAAFTTAVSADGEVVILAECFAPGWTTSKATATAAITAAVRDDPECSGRRTTDGTTPNSGQEPLLFAVVRREDLPGTLVLYAPSTSPPPTDEERELLGAVVREVAFALDALSTNRLRTEAMTLTLRRAEQQTIVSELGIMALGTLDSGAIIDAAVSAIAGVGVRQISLYELMPDADDLLVRAMVGEPSPVTRGDVLPRREVPMSNQALTGGEAVTVSDFALDERFPLDHSPFNRVGSAVSVPIRAGGHGVAALTAHSYAADDFDANDVHFYEAVAHVISGAIERERYEAAIRHDAIHDRLTGLPNRALLQDRLTQALFRCQRGQSGPLAVLVADIDSFKRVNDTVGHASGDHLLALIGERLREAVRPSDTVARLGGDQFVILCDELTDAAEAHAVAERIIERVGRPFVVDGREVVTTVSVGIATTAGDATIDGLLRDADVAMYRAKEMGRGRYELVDEALRTRLVDEVEIEENLRHATERGQLTVSYQPIVDLGAGAVREAEALLRWTKGDGVPVPPAEFIPVAERTGMIREIGAWVLATACEDAVRWNQRFPVNHPVGVAVNLSARQIGDPGLVTSVVRALSTTGLAPELLRLEITETALMEEGDGATATLQALDALGVRLSIDDFGTGYSSLMYLRRYPVRVLKVDRFFVAGLGANSEDDAIVQAVIGLAHSLGLSATAEGVETVEQLERLRSLRCDSAQGYLWSRAVPYEAFIGVIEALRTAVGDPVNAPEPTVEIPLRTELGESSARRCRVIIADDSASDRGLLRIALEESGYFIVVGEAADGEVAVALATEMQPDLLVLDMAMPGMNGLEALAPIHRGSPGTVVAFLSGFLSGALAQAATLAGASAQFDKSLPLDALVTRLTALHRVTSAAAHAVAAGGAGTIEQVPATPRPQPGAAPLMARPHGAEDLTRLHQGTRAFLRASTVEEIVEICCSMVRGMGGTVVAARLAGADALPLDLSFGHGEPLLASAPTEDIRRQLELVLPDLMEDARAAVASVRRTGMLASEATVDGLTALLNRRSIDRILARIKAGDVLVLIDLDHFKEVNDRLGHPIGDLVLTAFARVLRQQARAADRLGRLGGDEFVVILPGGDLDAPTALLTRLRDAWTEVRPQPVGFSAGVAVSTGGDPEDVLSRADQALYKDKASRPRRALTIAGGAA